MITALRPIVHKDAYTESVAVPITAYFTETIFGPLLAYLRENGVDPHASDQAIQHSRRPEKYAEVKAALVAGTLWYANGVFSGKWNAAISRELRAMGATFSNGVFRLAELKLPLDVKAAAVFSAQSAKQLHKGITDLIDQMQANTPKAPLGIEPGSEVEEIVKDLETQFRDTVADAATAPSAPLPAIAKRTADLMKIQIEAPIRTFTAEQLADLRARVTRNAVENGRADKLAKLIETRYGVAKRKALFLAEQETSLLVSKYRENRYKAIGLTRYKWSTSHDERVRHDHRLLNGTVQDWSVKPVTNRKTGARNHPGEDFRCLPGDSVVEFTGGIKKGFRRWFSGELTLVVLESGKTIRATNNHPVLTTRGWKPIGCLNHHDQLVELSDELLLSAEAKSEQRITTLGEIFETLSKAGLGETFAGKAEQFHGDGSNRDVDIVRAAGSLNVNRQADTSKRSLKFGFSVPCSFAAAQSSLREHVSLFFLWDIAATFMARVGQRLPFLKTHFAHSNARSFGRTTDRNASLNETAANDDALKTCALRNGKLALTGHVRFDERFWVKLQTVMGVSPIRIAGISREYFSGHVFNLETSAGYYTTQNVIVSNCRCAPIPIVPHRHK